MTLVVLIADGGPQAGLGHLSRCSALAVALQRQGAALRTLSLGLEEPLDRYGVRWEPVDEPHADGADVIVLDSYIIDAELRARLAANAPLVAFADDDGDITDATLTIRSGASSGRPNELAGLDYACLGPQFWSIQTPTTKERVERVLVATGAADHASASPRLAHGLGDALPGCGIAVVRGPYAPPADFLHGVRVVCTPESLFELLATADLVVTAAGQTMLEALAVGAPCVALVTAENQRRQASQLHDAGALTSVDTVEQAVSAASTLVDDFRARREQAIAGRQALDGRGAVRAADVVVGVARSLSAGQRLSNRL
jgi:spore coat polysaccharide biosynthesis predicted glycosyltransferase SpsG